MKMIPVLTCATLLIAGSAFAADAAGTASTSTSKPTASVKAPDACSKEATSKQLHGKARKSFLKSCRKGSSSN
ncbi:MAG: PsiF family protein [Steroidobacteraceae bacterium]